MRAQDWLLVVMLSVASSLPGLGIGAGPSMGGAKAGGELPFADDGTSEYIPQNLV